MCVFNPNQIPLPLLWAAAVEKYGKPPYQLKYRAQNGRVFNVDVQVVSTTLYGKTETKVYAVLGEDIQANLQKPS